MTPEKSFIFLNSRWNKNSFRGDLCRKRQMIDVTYLVSRKRLPNKHISMQHTRVTLVAEIHSCFRPFNDNPLAKATTKCSGRHPKRVSSEVFTFVATDHRFDSKFFDKMELFSLSRGIKCCEHQLTQFDLETIRRH